MKTEFKVTQEVPTNFKANSYSKEKFVEQTGVSFVLPKETTKWVPFNLSTSNMGTKCLN